MTAHLDNIHQTLSELAVGNPQWVLAAVQLNQTGGVRGGEGANRSASMVLHLHKLWANKHEPSRPKKYKAFFEMVDTRYTPEGNIGDSGEEVEDEDTGRASGCRTGLLAGRRASDGAGATAPPGGGRG